MTIRILKAATAETPGITFDVDEATFASMMCQASAGGEVGNRFQAAEAFLKSTHQSFAYP